MAGEKVDRCAGTDHDFGLQLAMMAMDPDFLFRRAETDDHKIGRRGANCG